MANAAKLYQLSYDYSISDCVLVLLNTVSIFLHGRIIEMKNCERLLNKRAGEAMIKIELSEGNLGALVFMLDAQK